MIVGGLSILTGRKLHKKMQVLDFYLQYMCSSRFVIWKTSLLLWQSVFII